MSDVTRILAEIEQGDTQATSQLLPLVYDELRRMARAQMASERAEHTLQATALVHEAYLRLVGSTNPQWDGRGHFFVAAAEAMRRILIEHARAKHRTKRGGGRERVELDDGAAVASGGDLGELLALDEVLDKLAAEYPAKGQLVKLRYFAGLSFEEAAAVLNISVTTAKRHWAFARAWLYDAMEGGK